MYWYNMNISQLKFIVALYPFVNVLKPVHQLPQGWHSENLERYSYIIEIQVL
jgi:hypothetical protein